MYMLVTSREGCTQKEVGLLDADTYMFMYVHMCICICWSQAGKDARRKRLVRLTLVLCTLSRVYVCIYVCMYVCVCVCTMYIYKNMCICIYRCIDV